MIKIIRIFLYAVLAGTLLLRLAHAADAPDQTPVLRAYVKHLQEDRAALQTQVDALRVQMDQDKDAAAADKAAAVKAVDDWWRGNPSEDSPK